MDDSDLTSTFHTPPCTLLAAVFFSEDKRYDKVSPFRWAESNPQLSVFFVEQLIAPIGFMLYTREGC